MSHVCKGLCDFEMNAAKSRIGGLQDELLCEVAEMDSYKMLKCSKGLERIDSRDMAAKNVREVPDLNDYADETDGCAIDVMNH